MIINILATLRRIAVVASLCGALYGWFRLSLSPLPRAWPPRMCCPGGMPHLAELSEAERDQQRTQPPVEVLEAIVALPSAAVATVPVQLRPLMSAA